MANHYDLTNRYLRKVKIEWSSDFAYAIGLIVSDGNLNKDGKRMMFKSKDLELVEKFKNALDISNKIGKSVRGGESEKKYFYVAFGDVIFYRFLNSIGIHSAKSKTIKDVNIPEIFFNDFIRGVFDGDGTFYTFWDKRWRSSFCYQASFASASISFVTWFRDRISILYGLKGIIVRGDGVYNIRYFKGDTKKLFQVMYRTHKSILYLDRKYHKMQEAFEFEKGKEFLKSRGSSVVEQSPDIFGPLRSNLKMKTG